MHQVIFSSFTLHTIPSLWTLVIFVFGTYYTHASPSGCIGSGKATANGMCSIGINIGTADAVATGD